MDIFYFSLLSAGLITGFSKFSIGGMGLLVLPIIMLAFPGPEALGVLIPIYVLTDIMAISSFRHKIAWSILLRLLPLAIVGILLGGQLLKGINSEQYRFLLGLIILCMIALSIYLQYKDSKFMQHSFVTYVAGFLSGFISLLANAAGPLVSLYLIEQKLSKQSYVSTRAWAFLIINLSKLPILYELGFITLETTKGSLVCIPGLIIGAFIGHRVLSQLNLSQFQWLIRIMAMLGAIKLFIFP